MQNSFRNNKEFDVSQLLKPYENKWVALSEDHREVLGAGDSLEEAERQAEATRQRYVFIKLPPFDVNYIPLNQ